MTSSFTWLDHSETARRRMLEAVRQFRDRDTLDEVGVGGIRDAFAERLFPSMSVLHTRARYLLFVPWVYLDIEGRSVGSARVTDEARRLQGRLRDALIVGDPDGGVIGRVAGEQVRILPSTAYWNALGALHIRQVHATTERYHRSLDAFYARRSASAATEDGEGAQLAVTNWDYGLPDRPAGLFTSAEFALAPEEAGYLRDRVTAHLHGSLLHFLVTHDVEARLPELDRPWDVPLDAAPNGIRRAVDLGRRFADGIRGATLLYNYLVARDTGIDEIIERHGTILARWHTDVASHPLDIAITDWDGFWLCVAQGNPRVSPAARAFVERWFSAVIDGGRDPETDAGLHQTVRHRERQLKGGLSRLGAGGERQREIWGAGATGVLTYRWEVVRRVIQDVRDGLKAGASAGA